MWSEKEFNDKLQEMLDDEPTYRDSPYNTYSWWDGFWYAVAHMNWINGAQYNLAMDKNWELYQNKMSVSYPIN